jgi:mono/diheme cytochrome c family protein
VLSLAGIVAAAVLVLGWWWLAGTHRAQAPGVAHTEPLAVRVAKGAYLARAGNCMNCHTRQGGEPYAGGRAIETPFGIVYSSNLTPDRTHGIGNWTSVDFWRALHEGRAPGGRLLYPAFPYTSFTQVNQDDADALFAYLLSLPAVRQPNRDHAMRWPYDSQLARQPGVRCISRRLAQLMDTRRIGTGCLSGSRSGPLQRLAASRNLLGAVDDRLAGGGSR